MCVALKSIAQEFLDLIQSLNFVQNDVGPTHLQGHRLDLVLSCGFSVFNLEIGDAVFFLIINLFCSTTLLSVSLNLPPQPGLSDI